MPWTVERVLNFGETRYTADGYAHLGFHDAHGNAYTLDYDRHWVGRLGPGGLLWTAGPEPVAPGVPHIPAGLRRPSYLSGLPDGTLLVASGGDCRVLALDPRQGTARTLIDGRAHGLRDLGNCEPDGLGGVWVNEITGCRVWCFDLDGRPVHTLGDGRPGFQPGPAAFDAVRFHWIYDLRRGPDGRIYVLDSRNYCVRAIDPAAGVVTRVAGTGDPGYGGDGGPALAATFGSHPAAEFDGPWSLAVDETGSLFVGDTQNHVVRRVDRATGTITTIAGTPNPAPGPNPADLRDPLAARLPRICSLDYHAGRLFVPEWDGDLMVLRGS